MRTFYQKELLQSKSKIINQEPDCHIRDKVEVVLDLSNYATKN